MDIITLPLRRHGYDARSYWVALPGSQDGGWCCVGCGSYLADRVTPVDVVDGGGVSPDSLISPLCRACSLRRAARIRAAWSLTPAEVVDLWTLVRREAHHG